jgi:SAM-dependent methyltransferase
MKLCSACQAPLAAGPVCAMCGYRIESRDGFELHAPQVADGAGGYDPAFYAALAALEDDNFWFQARNRLITRAIRRYFPETGTFLEIGCGTGQVLRAIGQALPNARISGSELFLEGLSFAHQRAPAAHLMQMDATRIPFSEEFDLIGAFDVIEHIEDDAKVLREAHKALRRTGGIILTVPQHPWLWSHQDDMAHHVRRYARHELETKLEDAGFRPIHSTSFVSLLLPAMMLSRMGRHRQSDDPLREFRIGRTTNRLLAAACGAECALISAGVRFPVGGSRLVVAKKEP